MSVEGVFSPLKRKVINKFDQGRLDATLLKLTKLLPISIHDLRS